MNDYQHPNLDRNLMGVQNAMEYNVAGEPALRVIGNNSLVSSTFCVILIDIPEIE